MQKSNLFYWPFLLIIVMSVIFISGCSNHKQTNWQEETITTGNLLVKINFQETSLQSDGKTISLDEVIVEISNDKGKVLSRETTINDDLIKFSFADLDADTVWTVNVSCRSDSGEIIYNKTSLVTIEKNKDKLISLDVCFSYSDDIYQKVFAAEETKEISLDYLGQDQYAIIGITPLSFNPDSSDFYDGSIAISGNKSAGVINNNVINNKVSIKKVVTEKRVHNQNQIKLDNYLRKQEIDFKLQNNIEDIKSKINSLHKHETYKVGDEKQFYVYDFSANSYRNVTAILKKVSDHAYLFVDHKENISSSILDQYASEFDNNIFSTNMEYFASNQYSSSYYDYDNNGKSIILFTLLDDEPANGLLMGFFNSSDFHDHTTFSHSNEADMFYINSYSVRNDWHNDVLSTIAHEFQHLIFFVEKYFYAERTGNDIWINEGFSGLAEYLTGYYNYSNDRRIFSGDGSTGYFDRPEYESLLFWDGRLSDYGASNLFAFYLYHRLGPSRRKQIMQEIISGEKNAVDVISDSYINFTDLYLEWITTNKIYNENIDSALTYPISLSGEPGAEILYIEDTFSIKGDAQKYYYIEGKDKAVNISIKLPTTRTGVIIWKVKNYGKLTV